MALTKQGDFSQQPSELPDVPSSSLTPDQIREKWQTPLDELKTTLDNAIDKLNSTTDGDSGADNVGATDWDGVTASTVGALLSWLKANKTDLTGDHKGTWQGFTPSQVDQTIRDQVNTNTSQLADISYLITSSMTQADINTALQNHNRVKFLNGTYNIDPVVGIKPKSNQFIEFESQVIIQANGTDQDHYYMLVLDNLSDVHIKANGAYVKGERSTHIGTTGEWGMGVSFLDSKNITIEDLNVNDCWGDGLYLGASQSGFNENITLIRVKADNNRRQGMSVVSVVGLTMEDCEGLNTNGTAPQAGIDFEPNYATQRLEKIVLKNFYSYNTQGNGIHFHCGVLPYVDIVVENHKHDNDTGLGSALWADGGDGTQEGRILVRNPIWKNTNTSPCTIRNRPATNARIIIEKPLIINCNKSGGTSPKYSSAFCVFAESTDTGTSQKIGNVHIIEPIVRGTSQCLHLLFVADYRNIGSDLISLINPIDKNGCSKVEQYISATTNFYWEDNRNVMEFQHDATVTLANYALYHRLTLKSGATATRKTTIDASVPVGAVVEFNNQSPSYTYQVGGQQVLGLATSTQTISLGVGALIKAQKINDTQWQLLTQLGTVTVA